MAARLFSGLCRSMSKVKFPILPVILLIILSVLGIFFLVKPTILSSFRPNIVLINIDLTRADHMSFYGYNKPTTPFLDSLFAKGIAFDEAITPAYLTWMTDLSILSSLYPSENFIDTTNYPQSKALATLPKVLSYQGYKTAAFVSEFLPERRSLNKLFDEYHIFNQENHLIGDNLSGTKGDVAKFVVDSKAPYFLFWNIDDLHTPYYREAASPFYTKDYHGPFADKRITWDWVDQPNGQVKRTDTGQYVTITLADREYLIGTYDTELNRIDQGLRDFFEQIKTASDFKNTIFIITSEHGEDLGEHGFFHHRDIYDVVTHVPLAIFGPGIPTKRISSPVSSLDIMPTILKLLSVPPPQNVEGSDLTPLLRGDKINSRDVYTERLPFDEYSVRQGQWKYILRNPNKHSGDYGKSFNDLLVLDNRYQDEFYNLDNDPYEQTNLIKIVSGVKDELKGKAVAFRERMKVQFDLNVSRLQNPKSILTYP